MRHVAILPIVIGLAGSTGCLDGGVVGRDEPEAGADTGISGITGQGGDAGKDSGAPTIPEAAPPIDGSSPLAEGGDGGTSGARPPAGMSLCGQGTFTQAESDAVCAGTAAGDVAVDYPLPIDGGAVSPVAEPHQCDGVTGKGGSWQVWCGAGGVYFFARWDHPLATGKMGNCPKGGGGEFLFPSEAWAGIYNAVLTRNASVGPGPLEPTMTPTGAHWVVNAEQAGIKDAAEAVEVELTVPASTLAHWDFGVDTVSHGSGYVFFGATLAGECNGTRPVEVGGVAVTWNAGSP